MEEDGEEKKSSSSSSSSSSPKGRELRLEASRGRKLKEAIETKRGDKKGIPKSCRRAAGH